ncbi:unnamed protein product [Caenorhabditis angaria]|uniref:Uncharacterized protein n=1 Tax=Caenorhabditis angaria TaxID=860376 RepID=A0A9P1MZD9_9PELO|nr:unnamed protein product [Caenorhabditis angaria]
MSYTNNHYNYQIAVVFAILIGGCLFLAAVIAAIYFVCVNNMRDDDKKRLNSGRNSATNWAPQQQQIPQSTYNPAPSIQNYDFNPNPIRSVGLNNQSYTPVPSTTPQNYAPNQNYQPVATPTTQQYIQQQQIPQYQPDIIYQQGPSSYSQQQPVEYTIQNPSNFVQSSV